LTRPDAEPTATHVVLRTFGDPASQEEAMSSNSDITKALFEAYIDKDRSTAERLLSEDFRFTSPLDNGINRKQYFEICWPNSATIMGVDFKHVVASADRVFVTYEATSTTGKRFRNTEAFTIRDGQIAEVEVYFGWNLPHAVPPGQHQDPS
jgi:ketosteroid isomerase-like protein